MQAAHGDQHFHRRVAGAGAQPGSGGVDTVGAGFDGGQGVGHAHGQVMVAVKAEFGFRLERLAHGADALFDVFRQQVAGGVGDVDAVGAIAFHQPGLLDQAFGAAMWAIIRKPTVSISSFAGHGDVLLGDIGFGAMGGDANGMDADVVAPS